MKNKRITKMSQSITKDQNKALSIFFKDLTLETDLKGLSTRNTLKGFKLNSSDTFCNRLATIIMKSS